ncbi:alpha/beta fold hydrolase [Alicyclobacillus shizuokensis]|uniref:alpha/beta fold hydrolase n=1 Tax=Alicyclobacillus shizuokensis TaxID=392014 RepID=UPI000835F151|nr:alpha/beta hydrolase [Alicyclobacillus shizuokensis]MCL6625357.1 alpha/beta fold hydrolase [Alicyclobacillus shizuokensis]
MLDEDALEQGEYIDAGGILTHYHVHGDGPPLVMIHGSGPGVSAWANWGRVIPFFGNHFRVYAPDIVGFGKTQRPVGISYGMDVWVRHIYDFVRAVTSEPVHLIGNSMGGALTLRLATEHPELCRRLVLMGSVGVPFEMTEGLRAVWGYRARDLQEMERLLDIFTYNKEYLTPGLAEMRYQDSLHPEARTAYERMFGEPLEERLRDMVTPDDDIRKIENATLIIHGREDEVIPLENAYRLFTLLPRAELHVFGQCGHWTQIERKDGFCVLVSDFLLGSDGRERMNI